MENHLRSISTHPLKHQRGKFNIKWSSHKKLGVRKNQGRWKINIKDNKLLPPKEVCDVLEAPREGRPANCLVREDNPQTGITKKKNLIASRLIGMTYCPKEIDLHGFAAKIVHHLSTNSLEGLVTADSWWKFAARGFGN